jgi:hypothetical protein
MASIATWVFVIYAGYCGMLFMMQRHMLFPRDLVEVPPGEKIYIPEEVEQIWLDTADGRVEAWFMPPVQGSAQGPAPAVIFGHGNAELIDHWPEEFRRFSEMGMGLLLVEYPGYGRSQGSPSQESVTRTFVAAYDWLANQKDVADPSRIVLFGRSLGGGAVCQLAAQRPSAALILMSAFTSARAFAKRYLAPGFLVRDPFDNLSLVKTYPGPVLVIHGDRDEVIPYGHGKKLAEAAQNGRLITYSAGHNDCPPNMRVFWKDMENFLRDTGILKSVQPPLPDSGKNP